MVAGQNAAYDQFPCQYQIFYRGKARQSMWYDPVFQVSIEYLFHPDTSLCGWCYGSSSCLTWQCII